MKRSITMLTLFAVAALLAAPVSADHHKGWHSLFDGKTLEGWDGREGFWSVQDGAITGLTTPEKPTKGNTFIIYRGKKDGGEQFGDFELKMKYRIGEKGNSGIQYRSWEIKEGSYVIGGYQADIDSGPTYSGINYGEKFRGILAKRGQKTVIQENGKPKVVEQFADGGKLNEVIKKGEWNDYHIIAKGFNFKHYINGKLMCEVTDEDTDTRREKGVIALQLHAGPPMKVQFKDIKIKPLGKGEANAVDGVGADIAAAGKAGEKLLQGKRRRATKKVVFVAGGASHGFGGHDHKAGSHLFAKWLEESGLGIECEIHYPGWPSDASIFDGADAVIIYSNGGAGHPAIRDKKNAEVLDKLVKQGVGVGCIHYAVEVPKGTSGEYMLRWTGGYFETNWSVNPHWTIKNAKLAEDHPITRGVQPFEINDEWYYHMRFRENLEGVTPILSALPPKDSLRRGDGPHSNNPHVRKAVLERKENQHVMWAYEGKPDGAAKPHRGFGFTGGHVHWNWANANHRTLVLNAIAWTAGVDVPKTGVPSKTPTLEEMLANHDDAPPADKINREQIRKKLEELAGKKIEASE